MKKIITFAAVVFSAAFLMSACCSEKRDLPKGIDGKAIAKTAKSWIVKLDKGYFQQCYDETSQTLKNNLDRKQWFDNMTAYRKPLGESGKRKEINMFYEAQLQTGERGDFVTVQYGSVFQQKLAVVENITFVKEEDDSWRILVYWLK